MKRHGDPHGRLVAAVVIVNTLLGLAGHALADERADAVRSDTRAPAASENDSNDPTRAVDAALDKARPSLVTLEIKRRSLLPRWALDGLGTFSFGTKSEAGNEDSERTVGLVLDKRGVVLTSTRPGGADDAKITATLKDGRSFTAKLKGRDAESGLTVVALTEPPTDLEPAKLLESDVDSSPLALVKLGHDGRMAASSATLLRDENGGISATTSDWTPPRCCSQGSGVLLTLEGAVVGVCKTSSAAPVPYPSFPLVLGTVSGTRIDLACEIARQLEQKGKVIPGWLGATLEEPGWIESAVVEAMTRSHGLRLSDVATEGPAARAGLRDGDVVVAVDGRPILSRKALIRRIEVAGPGRTVTLEILRNGQRQSLGVTLGERPSTPATSHSVVRAASEP